MTDGPNLFRQVVSDQHLQVYETFVELFERTAEDLADETGENSLRTVTVSRRQLDRWLGGDLKSLPRPRQCRILERMLGHRAQDLFSSSEPVIDLRHPEPSATIFEEAAASSEQATQFTTMVESQVVGELTLEDIESNVRRLMRLNRTQPVEQIFGQMTTTQAVVFTYLNMTKDTDQLRRLYRAAGLISGLIARSCHDLGNMHASASHARAAFLAAERSGDLGLRGWVRCLQALSAYWNEDYDTSLRFASDGLAHYHEETDVLVWLYSAAARAFAHLGDKKLSDENIDHARRARNNIVEDTEVLWGAVRFSEEMQIVYEADCRLLLDPNNPETLAIAEESFASLNSNDQTLYGWIGLGGARTIKAKLFIRLGRITDAHETLRPILDEANTARVNGIAHSMASVKVCLKESGNSTVEAFTLDRQLADFISRINVQKRILLPV